MENIDRYNGYLPAGERGRRRSKFVLYRRPAANGVRRSKHYVVKTPHSSKAILDASQHSISYTLSRSQAVIVEYTEDPDTDMFQVSPGHVLKDLKECLLFANSYKCQLLQDKYLDILGFTKTILRHLSKTYSTPYTCFMLA